MKVSKSNRNLSLFTILLVTAFSVCPGNRADKLGKQTSVPLTLLSVPVILQADGTAPPPPPPPKKPLSSARLV